MNGIALPRPAENLIYENPVLVATLTAFSREAWAFDGQLGSHRPSESRMDD
jgi:hypothetical protein